MERTCRCGNQWASDQCVDDIYMHCGHIVGVRAYEGQPITEYDYCVPCAIRLDYLSVSPETRDGDVSAVDQNYAAVMYTEHRGRALIARIRESENPA